MQKSNFLDFLNKCIQKDKTAWDEFVDRYSQYIYNYIIHTLKRYNYAFQVDEIEEIFNNIFLSLLDKNCKSLRNFHGQYEHSLLAYLRTISFNTTIDYLRAVNYFVDFDKVGYQIGTETRFKKIHLKDLREIIEIIKDNLPERHSRLFEMLYEKDLNQSEISEIMDLKSNAVHQLKHRMMKNVIKIAKRKNLYHDLKTFKLDSCSCLSTQSAYSSMD